MDLIPSKPTSPEEIEQTSKKVIRLFSGITIENRANQERHPLTDVKEADNVIKSVLSLGVSRDCHSNSPDFVMALFYGCKYHKIEFESFLDGVSCGNDIETIFGDFNKSLDEINRLYTLEND